MALYRVDGPDGKTYEVEGPDGATDEQVIEHAKSQIGQQQAEPEPQQTAPAPDEHPRWDFLGDTGRAAQAAGTDLVKSAGEAFPSAETSMAQNKANREKYGLVGGALKSGVVDSLGRFGSALKIPLDAAGVVTSPITGALHAGLGSALSYLPGMENKGAPPEAQAKIKSALDNAHLGSLYNPNDYAPRSAKETADNFVDQSSLGLGPGSMRAGSLPAQAASVAASRATAARAAQVNAMGSNAAAAASDPMLVQARQAGYVLHPADASPKPGFVADTASGLGGKIKTQQEASSRNQSVTNRLAAEDLGLSKDAVLDEATFNRVRAKAGDAYQTIEDSAQHLPNGVVKADQQFLNDVNTLDTVGDDLRRDFPEIGENPDIGKLQASIAKDQFSPKAGVEAIKHLRFSSKENFKAMGDPTKKRLAQAQRDAATALEDLIERGLEQTGNKTAVQDFRSARQLIAKSHDIESVTDAAGNVDARKLATLGNRRPLTGNLKIISDTADRYPKSMQMPSKFGGVEKRSVLDTFATVGSIGGAVGTGNPLLALGATVPLARPLARSFALSNKVQNRLAGVRSGQQSGSILKQSVTPTLLGQNYSRLLLDTRNKPPEQE